MGKLRLLLDENLGVVPARALRKAGFDVVSIAENDCGISDDIVIRRAHEEKRIVVTLDKDFGTLVYREHEEHCGVVLLRLAQESAQRVTEILVELFKEHGQKLENKFTVVTETSIRIRG